MSKPLPILANARIASPCNMSWNAMTGDDHTRYCDQCEKNVFNLVGMSDDEATMLIREKEGKLCVRLYQRPDGTLLTSDCPVGLQAARPKLAKAVGAIAACVTMVVSAATFGMSDRINWRIRDVKPFSRIASWFTPPTPTSTIVYGALLPPSPDEANEILKAIGLESATGDSVKQCESEALGPVYPIQPQAPANIEIQKLDQSNMESASSNE